MSQLHTRKSSAVPGFLSLAAAAGALLLATAAHAAAPGIKGSSFTLNAGVGYSSQPDGELIYSWGYGCTGGTLPTGASFAPAQFAAPVGFCPPVQLPGPTLIVTEGAGTTFTVTLTNNLPAAAGNTSIIFPGLQVSTSCPASNTAGAPQRGLLTCEAVPGGTVTYTVSIPVGSAGTHLYQSGTQPDLQIEMGLFGAVIVLPSTTPSNCAASSAVITGHREDYRLAQSAYDHALTCYDREYLTQWSEMDPRIHRQAEAQAAALVQSGACPATVTGSTVIPPTCHLDVATEPYHPNYFMINGRSMPDNMDANYAPNYPIQPYNANPHMHPGELVLVRTTGQGHWQHPFHEHGNHVRILARDANLLLAQVNNPTGQTLLAGRMEFDTDTTPGQAFDGIFYWSGKGLGWDIFGHTPGNAGNPNCTPDANGYYTNNSHPAASIPTYNSAGQMISGATNYYEWCGDHNVPLEANPVSTNVAGTVGAGGPMTLMDPLVLTNGLWYNGTPYLGPDAVNRSRGPTPLPPGSATQNPLPESGIAFMWHSHNEREITTNDVFPGGMLMMMLVDPYVWNIDETL
jgi:FtsP/CotA-like multicopper oxidase with cupredoxin domain